MQLRRTPRITARYWTALLIASTLGTNFGDLMNVAGWAASSIFASAFGISMKLAPRFGEMNFGDLWGPAFGLVFEGAMLGAIFLMDSRTSRGAEASYWMAILVVRAIATNVADYGGLPVDAFHVPYTPFAVAEIYVSAIVFAVLVTKMVRRSNVADVDDLPPTDWLYWSTMLMAGVIGTIIGDWVRVDVAGSMPLGLLFASLTLAILFLVRARAVWSSLASYWICIVAVRWWGTNLGDLIANRMKSEFIARGLTEDVGWMVALSIGSAAGAVLLTILLLFWRTPLKPQNSRQSNATGGTTIVGDMVRGRAV